MPRKRTTRNIFIIAAACVAVLVIFIALIPAMVNRGLGHGAIRNALENQVNGTVDFQQVRVSWFGPQSMTGLRIVDEAGLEAALLNVSVSEGLLPLVFGPSSINATVAGTARGELHEDGSVSFQRLAVDRPEREPQPLNLEGMPATRVSVNTLTLFLRDAAAGHEIVVEDLSGEFVYVPGSDLGYAVTGTTVADGRQGTLASMGSAPGLFDRAGRFTPDGAPVELSFAVSSIPLPGVDVPSVLHNLSLELRSQNLTESVSVAASGDGSIEGEQPSRFTGEFRVRNPIRQDGSFDFSMERVEGGLTGEAVPTSLLQVAFNNTPVVLRRDVGGTVDVDVQLRPGEQGTMFVRAVGQRATVELSALEENGWWIGDRLALVTPEAHPALIEGYTGLTVENPTDVEILLSSFAVPPFDEQLDARPWGFASATGSLRVNGPANVLIGEDNPVNETTPIRFSLTNLNVNLDSAQLGDTLYLDGTAMLDGADVSLDYLVTNLADAQGRIDPANAQPVGILQLQNFPASSLAQAIPQQTDLLAELLGQSINATLQTSQTDDGLRGELNASGNLMRANVAAVRMADALRLIDGRVDLSLTPSLMTALVNNTEQQVQLMRNATASLELAPTDFPGSGWDYQWRGVPITALFEANNLVLDGLPGLEEPAGLNNVRATVDAAIDEQWSLAANGRANLRRASANRRIAQLVYNLAAAPQEDQPLQLNGTLSVNDLLVNDLEAMLGHEAGFITNWVGDSGSLHARIASVSGGYEAELTPQLQRLTGTFSSSLINEQLRLDTDDAAINLGAAALQRMLDPEGAGTLEILDDVPMQLSLQSTLPLTLFQEEPYDPQRVDVTARFAGGPLVMLSNGEQSTFSDVLLAVRSEAVGDGVDFIINIDAGISESPETAQRGELGVEGRVRNGFTDQRMLDLDASVVRAPAVIADSLLNMNGYLVSTVGNEISATITTREFSRNSGTLNMEIDALHGWMRAAASGSDGMLVFAEGSPIEGELSLTPLLRDRLLGNLHPLLGDIVSMPEPMRILISNATVPMDGDISRLNADLQLTIGEVDIDPRTEVFSLLRMASGAEVQRLDGFIDPISARVRDGVISYDQFNVTIDRLTIPYTGQINLVDRSINLRTVMPLGQLLVSGIREIPEEARMISVPLVTRGSFDDLRTDIDPQFDLSRALIEAGVRRGLDELIPRDRLPFDLRDLIPR